MKRLVVLFSVVFSLLAIVPFYASAQTKVAAKKQRTVSDIRSSLKLGNATALLSNLAENVNVNINDDDDTYSKSEAVTTINSFFQDSTPSNFIIKHQGTAPSGARFVIGSLVTKKGTYRTYMVLKNGLIEEISFEE